jgi:hypothetical protein
MRWYVARPSAHHRAWTRARRRRPGKGNRHSATTAPIPKCRDARTDAARRVGAGRRLPARDRLAASSRRVRVGPIQARGPPTMARHARTWHAREGADRGSGRRIDAGRCTCRQPRTVRDGPGRGVGPSRAGPRGAGHAWRRATAHTPAGWLRARVPRPEPLMRGGRGTAATRRFPAPRQREQTRATGYLIPAAVDIPSTPAKD